MDKPLQVGNKLIKPSNIDNFVKNFTTFKRIGFGEGEDDGEDIFTKWKRLAEEQDYTMELVSQELFGLPAIGSRPITQEELAPDTEAERQAQREIDREAMKNARDNLIIGNFLNNLS